MKSDNNYKSCVENETRLKNPGRTFDCDHKNSRKAAIDLMCISCMTSIHDVEQCKSYTCPLWTFRPGNGKSVVPDGFIPSKELIMSKLDRKELVI